MPLSDINVNPKKIFELTYDAVSVWVQDLVPKSDESESGQMVSEKVKWT